MFPQDVIGSNIHAADNQRFLEHFRYVIIASNLLTEQTGRQSFRPDISLLQPIDSFTESSDQETWTIEGAVTAVGLPASIAGLVRWVWIADAVLHKLLRIFVTVAFFIVASVAVLSHLKRQTLKSLRQRAVAGAFSTVSNLQALEQSSKAAFTLVKEVELVSRGYVLKSPHLPPISILEENGPKSQSRRCSRIRRILRQLYAESMPLMIDQCNDLAKMVIPDDLEKYLDVYEIAEPDVQEAFTGALISEIDDQESLSALRAMQWRFNTLRKVVLCHLLALPANGTQSDGIPWRTAVNAMETLSFITGLWAEKLNDILKEDEQAIVLPSPSTNRNTPERERSRQQLRKINELSAELRAMQAKLHILRDDARLVLDGDGHASSVASLFTLASESIGHDLRNLNHTFDSWRTSLLPPPDRRHSRASSELRSPISLGGLTVVDEVLNGPSEALRALNGESSLSGSTAGSDEEVFEAVAFPRIRRSMTREEKIAKLQDEEARRAIAREQRMQGVNMVKELETVMNTRLSKRMSTGRLPVSTRISSI
jgi:hypothetical protein